MVCTTGTPTSYIVRIHDASNRNRLLSATVYSQTSFQVPPGIMVAGKTYFAVITARAASGQTIDTPPLRIGVPSASADCVTASFSP